MDLGDLTQTHGDASERHDIVMKLASEATEGTISQFAVRKAASCSEKNFSTVQEASSGEWSLPALLTATWPRSLESRLLSCI